MRFLVIVIGILMSFSSVADTAKRWSNLEAGLIYNSNQEIELESEDSTLIIDSKTSLTFIGKVPLGAIKVQLYKFKVSTCTDSSMITELELLEVEQPNGVAVVAGVELAENCILELFIETKDFNTISIFN